MTEAESRIDRVTLYARGARVRRTLTIEAAPRVRLVGLPSTLIDDSVRVSAEGGAIVTAIHVGVHAPVVAPEDGALEVAPEIHAARQRVALAEAEVARLKAALGVLAQAPIALSADTDEPPPAWAAVVDARRQLVALRAERELTLRAQAAAAARALELAQQALTAATDRAHRAGSAKRPKLHELRKHVELELSGDGPVAIWLEYQVAAARWAPSYVARLDGDRVAFELRAVVAQDSGEDWRGVALQLSTAEPERFAALPELASQRIGRRQVEPARAGFRAPPDGAGALYDDYVRAFPDTGDGEPTQERVPAMAELAASLADDDTDTDLGRMREQTWDEETSRARQAPMMRPASRVAHGRAPMAMPAPPSAPMAAPMAAMAMAPPPAVKARGMIGGAARTMMASAAYGEAPGGGGGAPRVEPPPAPRPRLDYTNLRMAPPGSGQRGQLAPAPRDPINATLDADAFTRRDHLELLRLPAGCRADWP
ncbi:MAG TPA: DUF4139 domain-containing protein, partial [Kofleriaceae bacterium]